MKLFVIITLNSGAEKNLRVKNNAGIGYSAPYNPIQAQNYLCCIPKSLQLCMVLWMYHYNIICTVASASH